jgi:energy-coupling factor transporter ATP-binding protein EcfA2
MVVRTIDQPHEMSTDLTDTSPDSQRLEQTAQHVAALAARRLHLAPVADEPLRRAGRLLEHMEGHVLPRARSLDAPLLVLLLGPTGSGKSTIMNTLAGRPVSRTGVLRPTTREVVAHLHPDDVAAVLEPGGALARVPSERRELVEDPNAPRGLVILDAPDIDSVEHANRELADRLAEAADLCLFTTTATRYADRVPWDVLSRVRDRGLPLLVIVNRMPPNAADRAQVIADVGRLLAEAGFGRADRAARAEGGTAAVPDGPEIIAVAEGAIDPEGEAIERDALRPVLDRIEELGASRDERRALAARALAGSLAGLGPLVDQVADDLAHEVIELDALRRTARDRYGAELSALRDELGRGTFLRETALRQWQSYVGADEITRLFSKGIGRLRGTIVALVRGAPPAPIEEVREDTMADLVAVCRARAAEAARRTSAAWSSGAEPGPAVAADPALWSVSGGFDERLRARLEAWLQSIGEDIRETGAQKRTLARGATVGVNAAAVGVMLATFSHTGGLTGAEMGVAAATAFLNQKLLGALFGEAAMTELVTRARQRLAEAIGQTFGEEQARFEQGLSAPDDLRGLEADLREAAAMLRRLPPSVPLGATGVMQQQERVEDGGWPEMPLPDEPRHG